MRSNLDSALSAVLQILEMYYYSIVASRRICRVYIFLNVGFSSHTFILSSKGTRKRNNVPAAGRTTPHMPERLDEANVESFVMDLLQKRSTDTLPENELGDAVGMFVEKDDKDAIRE